MKTFARPCFSCGADMTLVKGTGRDGLRPFVECRACEVSEDATINGRFTVVMPEMTRWAGEFIMFIDHGTEYAPSPG